MASIGDQIGDIGNQIPKIVLLAIVVAVLLPAANYSLNLIDPTPSQLLVAISIGVFSSTLCLWLMDAVSVLKFRSEWVSRGVWGAAIVSILSTGVGVFQGALSERKYQFEGKWEARFISKESGVSLAEVPLNLTYSISAETYWGFSKTLIAPRQEESQPISIEIIDLNFDSSIIVYKLKYLTGAEEIYEQPFDLGTKRKHINSSTSSGVSFTLSRPK